LTDQERDEIAQLSKKVHTLLGLKQLSKIDMILTPKGIYFLEINTVPNFSDDAPFMKSLRAVGSTPTEFVVCCVKNSLV